MLNAAQISPLLQTELNSYVIWIAEEVRNEHRRALEWLNQKTGADTHFFAVEVEGLQIDDSRHALNFKPVVFPPEWLGSQRWIASISTSAKFEKYREYFQRLIDELKESHGFPGAVSARAQSDYRQYFAAGVSGIYYRVAFAKVGNRHQVAASVYMGGDNHEALFDALDRRNLEINSNFGMELEWERKEGRKHSTISIYRDGVIESIDEVSDEIKEWHIEKLLKLKEVVTPEIERELEKIDSDEF